MALPGILGNEAKSYIFMNKNKIKDGYGAQKEIYVPGFEFEAAVVVPQNIQTEIAKKDGITSIYRVATDKSVYLDFGDVFKDKETGETYRVTTKSNIETPETSSMDIRTCSAEEWVIPDE